MNGIVLSVSHLFSTSVGILWFKLILCRLLLLPRSLLLWHKYIVDFTSCEAVLLMSVWFSDCFNGGGNVPGP